MTATPQHDPEQYRMTIGDHLEELRGRLFLGFIPFILLLIAYMVPAVGERVVHAFCRPLIIALQHNGLSTQLIYRTVEESFMVFIRIGLVSSVALASPWLVYQIWQFVAAGLYPHERRYVTKYLPLSIGLLILGMLFLYFFVLPLMLEFFLAFNLGAAFTNHSDQTPLSPTSQPAIVVPVLNGNPPAPQPGQLWYDRSEGRLKIALAGEVRVLTFGSDKLATPQITLADYIDMVIGMLLSFGLAFQMPLVVLALVSIGVMEIATLKSWRRYVYFGMTILAAFIVPDVATGMVALLVPLCLLYEFGILLATTAQRKAKKAGAT